MDNLRRIICTKDEINALPLTSLDSSIIIKKLYIPLVIDGYKVTEYGGIVFSICDINGDQSTATVLRNYNMNLTTMDCKGLAIRYRSIGSKNESLLIGIHTVTEDPIYTNLRNSTCYGIFTDYSTNSSPSSLYGGNFKDIYLILDVNDLRTSGYSTDVYLKYCTTKFDSSVDVTDIYTSFYYEPA